MHSYEIDTLYDHKKVRIVQNQQKETNGRSTSTYSSPAHFCLNGILVTSTSSNQYRVISGRLTLDFDRTLKTPYMTLRIEQDSRHRHDALSLKSKHAALDTQTR